MKLAVLGPGALGCLMAALFREAGVEVCLVDYRPDRAARLQLRGIQVHTLEGEPRVPPRPVSLIILNENTEIASEIAGGFFIF